MKKAPTAISCRGFFIYSNSIELVSLVSQYTLARSIRILLSWAPEVWLYAYIPNCIECDDTSSAKDIHSGCAVGPFTSNNNSAPNHTLQYLALLFAY